MQQADFDSFSQMLGATADLYGKTVSEMSILLWWNALLAYELAAVREGLSRHMQNPDSGQYMPKPADVIRFIGGGTTQDGALLAWAKVDRAVRSVGTYQTVVFDDALIHAVITDMGGWVAMGTRLSEEWPFVAKEFENRYRGYCLRGGAGQFQKKLMGIAEAGNLLDGHTLQAPVLIGHEGKACQVLAEGSGQPVAGWRQMDAEAYRVLLASAPKAVAA